MKVITFIFCHEQNIILDSIKNKKYKDIEKHYYVFLGFNEIDRIENIENVIICRNLPDNIEFDVHCLQYTGWYSVFKNIDLDCDYIRLIDYDVDILVLNNETNFKIKSGLSFGFDFYFDYGFKECDIFKTYIKSSFGISVTDLIANYKKNINQTDWFSIGDVLIETQTFKNFMNWIFPVYLQNKHLEYFSHHFERYITIFCLLNNIEYEIKKNEIIHKQLKSHKYY